MVLRRKLWRQPEIYVWLPVIGFAIATMTGRRAHVVGPLLVIGVIVVLEAWAQARVRITVTASQVLVSDMLGRNAMPRADLASIHVFPRSWESFYDKLGYRAMRSGPYWTRRQLLDLAEQLRVPLIVHRRRWLGFGPAVPGAALTRTPGQRYDDVHEA
jgi:hypothetical protein